MEAAMGTISVKRYQVYKESGVEWLGEVPIHWEVSRLGRVLAPTSIRNQAELPLLSITREKGVILRDMDEQEENHNFIPDDLSNYKILRAGEFGMNKMKAWQGSYGISPYTGIVSPAYYTFTIDKSLIPEYFHLAIRSKLYVSYFGAASDGVRVGQWDLSRERLKQIPILIPPKEEQTAIASFLDRKTAQVDTAIAQKEKLIELLKERKQILIHKVVTRGLNPDVRMKDSGVEWIGKIPEHWEVKKLKYLINGKLKYGANETGVEYQKELPRYIRITDFGQDGKLSEDGKLSLTWGKGKHYLLKDGDILFARNGATVGKSYQFKLDMSFEEYYAFAGYLIKAEPNENIITSDFLYLYTNSTLFTRWKDIIFNKATIENIGADKYSQLQIVVPPIKEQIQILNWFSDAAKLFDAAASSKKLEIEKLKEYKAALINAAVTGKIKVC